MRDRLLNETGDLVDFGARHGVVIAMEPHIGCCLCDVERTLWLLGQIDSEYLKLNYDISHFDVAGVPTAESVAALAPHTIHTHVKDQRGTAPDFEFLIPGEGDFDYVEYLDAMKAAGYDDYNHRGSEHDGAAAGGLRSPRRGRTGLSNPGGGLRGVGGGADLGDAERAGLRGRPEERRGLPGETPQAKRGTPREMFELKSKMK